MKNKSGGYYSKPVSIYLATQKAQKAGATHYREFRIRKKSINTGLVSVDPDVFMYHFFNKEDKEIGYYCADMYPHFEYHPVQPPREWSKEFKAIEAYTLKKFNTNESE